jgi:hypothetical protein
VAVKEIAVKKYVVKLSVGRARATGNADSRRQTPRTKVDQGTHLVEGGCRRGRRRMERQPDCWGASIHKPWTRPVFRYILSLRIESVTGTRVKINRGSPQPPTFGPQPAWNNADLYIREGTDRRFQSAMPETDSYRYSTENQMCLCYHYHLAGLARPRDWSPIEPVARYDRSIVQSHHGATASTVMPAGESLLES